MMPRTQWSTWPCWLLFLPLLLLPMGFCACRPQPPLSAEAETFRQEIRGIIERLQKSLAAPTAERDIAAIDKVLATTASTVPGICLDCPYRSGVLDVSGILLTTFPKTDIVGMNFSSYSRLRESMQRQRITQRPVFLPDRSKMYFISAPLIHKHRVVGAVVLGLTAADLEKKWHLQEKEFLAINLNTP
ncbi:MAG: hypothetical protein ACUVRZ_05530 [Desulfobacca sp.]|uniref:hypothetical protein n=1 Tax=Desulfobacca sp. TaxID=2067990 RepID=UPI00404B70C3